MNGRGMLDLTGRRYGRLIAVRFVRRELKHSLWECICVCGRIVNVRLNNLQTGHTKSCGCYHLDVSKSGLNAHPTHGHVLGKIRTPTYQSWRCMRERCLYPSNASYKYYGAKGIKFTDRWNKFENFLIDMGERPEGTTLDRINPYKDYSLDNCRWATEQQQKANKRKHYVGA